MRPIYRHAGVFCLAFAAALLTADWLGETTDAGDVYFYFGVAFIAYLGISYLRGRQREG